MEAIKNIIKLPERKPEESAEIQADSKIPPKSLIEIQAAIRAGRSERANSLMNTPAIYKGKGLPNTKQAKRALQVLQSGQSLFLTGIPGSGKTHTAIALTNEWFADKMQNGDSGPYFAGRGYPVFLPAVELLLEIKESWHNEESVQAESEKRILDKYAGKTLLVIDDLGKGLQEGLQIP